MKSKQGLAKENGITLIALIIIIIVLLILAGISIAMLSGDNSIVKNAQQARVETEKAEIEEKVKLAVMGSYNSYGVFDVAQLKAQLDAEGIAYTQTDDNNIEVNIPNGNKMIIPIPTTGTGTGTEVTP